MFEFVYLSLGAWWFIYSISIAVGKLIKRVIDGSLLIAFLAVFCNLCLSINEAWLATIGDCRLRNH